MQVELNFSFKFWILTTDHRAPRIARAHCKWRSLCRHLTSRHPLSASCSRERQTHSCLTDSPHPVVRAVPRELLCAQLAGRREHQFPSCQRRRAIRVRAGPSSQLAFSSSWIRASEGGLRYLSGLHKYDMIVELFIFKCFLNKNDLLLMLTEFLNAAATSGSREISKLRFSATVSLRALIRSLTHSLNGSCTMVKMMFTMNCLGKRCKSRSSGR